MKKKQKKLSGLLKRNQRRHSTLSQFVADGGVTVLNGEKHI